MDAKVDIKFDSREKKWSGSGDTRKVSQSLKKSDKFDERKQKTRLRWTKNMTWKRFNDETGEAEYVLFDD